MDVNPWNIDYVKKNFGGIENEMCCKNMFRSISMKCLRQIGLDIERWLTPLERPFTGEGNYLVLPFHGEYLAENKHQYLFPVQLAATFYIFQWAVMINDRH